MNIKKIAATVTLSLVGGLFAALGTTTTAHAAIPPVDSRPTVVLGSVGLVGGMTDFLVRFGTPDGSKIPAGSVVTLIVRGCGGKVLAHQPQPVWDNGLAGMANSPRTMNGNLSDSVVAVNWAPHPHRAQPLTYTITFSIPGFDTYAENGTYDGAGGSCSGNTSSGTGTQTGGLVAKWSTKSTGKPRAGKVSRVTRTKSSGRVSYRWTLNGRTVGHNKPQIKATRAMVGKRLAVKIVVTKGATTKVKTLRFGKVRRR